MEFTTLVAWHSEWNGDVVIAMIIVVEESHMRMVVL